MISLETFHLYLRTLTYLTFPYLPRGRWISSSTKTLYVPCAFHPMYLRTALLSGHWNRGSLSSYRSISATTGGHSFDARPPNDGYANHFSDETKEKSIKGRVKTSLRNVKSFFSDFLDMRISHETVRKNVPDIPHRKVYSSGYFV